MSARVAMRTRRLAAVVGAASVLAGLVVAPAGASSVPTFWDGAPLGDARSWQIRTTSSALTGGSLDNATALQRAQAVGNVAPDGALRTWKGVPASAAWNASKGGTAMLGATAFMASFEGTNMILRAAGVDNVGLEAVFPAEPDPNWYPNANVDVELRTPGWVNGGTVSIPTTYQGQQFYNSANVTVKQAPFYGEKLPSGLLEVSVGSWGGPAVYWNENLGLSYRTFVRPSTGTGAPVQWGGGVLSPPYRGTPSSPVPQAAVHEATVGFGGLDRFELVNSVSGMGVDAGTVLDTWYPVGHPQRPPDMDANPVRRWETRYGCSSGSGGVNASALFRELDDAFPEFPQAGPCEAGTLSQVEIWQVTPNGESDDVKIIEWEPTGVVEWAGTFPQCTDGSCVLELFRIDPETNSRLDCFVHPSACLDWWDNPNRDELFECRYGGTTVALAECSVYRPTINKLAQAPVRDDEGKTRPASEVGPHGDPGDEGNPVPIPVPPAGPPGGPSGAGDCSPAFEFTLGGVGYWIVQGLKCAFVPQRQLETSKVSTAVNATAVGQLWGVADRLFGGIGDMRAGTCGVIASSDISVFGGRSLTIDTCQEPWPSFAPVRQVLGWAFIIFAVVVGVMTCLNTIRVKPVSGKDA